MQPAHPPHHVDPWPQVEMVGIPQQNLDSQLFEHVLGHALHRGQRSNGHEDGRLDDPVGRDQLPEASGALS